MSAVVRAAVVLAALTASAPAFACHHGFHSHLGGESIVIGFGGLPFFSMGVAVHHEPCPAYVVAPPVVVAPPPIIEQVPVYVPPPQVVRVPVYVQAPPLIAAPPIVAVPTPTYVPAPPPTVAVAPRMVDPDRPNHLAFKYMTGWLGDVDNSGLSVGRFGGLASLGAELRLARWIALRSDLEYRPNGRSIDFLGVKLWLDGDSALRPYASVSLTGEFPSSRLGSSYLGLVGAAGLDLFLGRYLFIEAEARVRQVHDCCGESLLASGTIGGGLAFF
jgi:hypothetical protein